MSVLQLLKTALSDAATYRDKLRAYPRAANIDVEYSGSPQLAGPDIMEGALSQEQYDHFTDTGVLQVSQTDQDGKSYATAWKVSKYLYAGRENVRQSFDEYLERANDDIFFQIPRIAKEYGSRVGKSAKSGATRIIDSFIGTPKLDLPDIETYLINSVWLSVKEREEAQLTVDSEWKTDKWDPNMVPLPTAILSFFQLWYGSNELYNDATMLLVKNTRLDGANDGVYRYSGDFKSDMEILTRDTVAFYREDGDTTLQRSGYDPLLDEVVKVARYGPDEIANAVCFKMVTDIWNSRDLLMASQLKVERDYPISVGSSETQIEYVTGQREAAISAVRMELLLAQLKITIDELDAQTDDGDSGMFRTYSLLAALHGWTSVGPHAELSKLYVSELRVVDDRERFTWGDNGDENDRMPIVTAQNKDSRRIEIGDKLFVQKDYEQVVIEQRLGWRLLYFLYNTTAGLWNSTLKILEGLWWSSFSIRRLGVAGEFDGLRDTEYAATGAALVVPVHPTIGRSYANYLDYVQKTREELIASASGGFISNVTVLTVIAWIVTVSQQIYGVGSYLLVQPILILLVNLLLLVLLAVIYVAIPLWNLISYSISALVYDYLGENSLFPPVRAVVGDLVLDALRLLVVGMLRASWYAITGALLAIWAYIYYGLVSLYNGILLWYIGRYLRIPSWDPKNPRKVTLLNSIATSVRLQQPSSKITAYTSIWSQPATGWLSKYITIEANSRLYNLAYSELERGGSFSDKVDLRIPSIADADFKARIAKYAIIIGTGGAKARNGETYPALASFNEIPIGNITAPKYLDLKIDGLNLEGTGVGMGRAVRWAELKASQAHSLVLSQFSAARQSLLDALTPEFKIGDVKFSKDVYVGVLLAVSAAIDDFTERTGYVVGAGVANNGLVYRLTYEIIQQGFGDQALEPNTSSPYYEYLDDGSLPIAVSTPLEAGFAAYLAAKNSPSYQSFPTKNVPVLGTRSPIKL
jgi:hypothetical protein